MRDGREVHDMQRKAEVPCSRAPRWTVSQPKYAHRHLTPVILLIVYLFA